LRAPAIADFAQSLPFDKDLRPDRQDQFMRRRFVEDDNRVDRLHARQQDGTILLTLDRASRAFQSANRTVAVEADDEAVAMLAGIFESTPPDRCSLASPTWRGGNC
jgi:hypothetical protein